MSIENVMKFYNEAVKDEVLRNKLQGINEKTLTKEVFESKVLPEAKVRGYDFSYADVQEYYKKQGEKTKLSGDDLENVSGGGSCSSKPAPLKISKDDIKAEECNHYEAKNLKEKKVCGNCRNYNTYTQTCWMESHS